MQSHSHRDIYNVTRLNREVKTLLEGFPSLWIEAELSNFKSYSSGHWYFSLKDENAQVSAAMFRGKNMLVKIKPRDGMQVLVRARVTLYEPRGSYQVIIEHMEEAGEGALRRAFEQLKQQLQNEGLFNNEHKQPVPSHPKCIGVITSPSGAAIHDIITTLQRRFPALPVILYPVAVQGENAAPEIVAAIQKANQRNECDVLIVGRGGGSLEDLWAFNEASVAHAIFSSSIPVISAVGHEVDFSIADFVADQRAATPTAAAEMISPDQIQYRQQLQNTQQHLIRLVTTQLQQQQQQVDWLGRQLIHPGRHLQEISHRLSELHARHLRALQNYLQQQTLRISYLSSRVQSYNPEQHLQQRAISLQQLSRRLGQAVKLQLHTAKQQLAHSSHSLEAVSPLSTLQRGYAIVSHDGEDKIIRNASHVKVGDTIVSRLAKGKLISTVNKVEQ